MNAFPLLRTKWSNEHVMAALFAVLVIYHIPVWREQPSEIYVFLLLTAVGLLLDTVGNLLRYKNIRCSVSAAVTAAIISVLTTGVALWGRLLGVAAALIFGKHLWGGTGKNRINPAMTGMLVVFLVSNIRYPLLPESYLLIPGVLLSLPFLAVRPYAGIGYLVGAAAAMLQSGSFDLLRLIASGGIFLACIVITDPVTVSDDPFTGSIGGFLTGFTALYFLSYPIVMAAGILGMNVISYLMEKDAGKVPEPLHKTRLRLDGSVPYQNNKIQLQDLTGEMVPMTDQSKPTAEQILERVRQSDVFGMGGAGFNTYRKLTTVISSPAEEKYFIINAVECDPGLVHDRLLLMNYPEAVRTGAELLGRCVEFSSVILAVKDTKALTIPTGLKVCKVSHTYPIGAEKILISEVLKKQLDQNQIPAEQGILVLNVQTVLSVYEAVLCNKKADTRYITVANLKSQQAKAVKVRLGMKVQEVLEAVYPGAMNAYVGGGLMQAHLAEEGAVIDRGINFIASARLPKYKESPQCSGCGICSRNCPAGLSVKRIADLVDQGKAEAALSYHPELCISCGSCSYSCLAGRNLALRVKEAKSLIK